MMTVTALPDGRIPVLLSAHTEELIGQDAGAILDHLQRRPALSTAADVARVASTLSATRRVRKFRALIRAADIAELTAALHALQTGADHPLVTRSAQTGAPSVAFVFPGQGSQWPSMGVEAYHRLTVYRDEADRCATAFADAGHASPLSYLLAAAGAKTNDFSQVQIQGAQFVHGVALARVWQSCGVSPDITVGHSLGEIGAAHIAGAITLADAVGVVAARATLLDGLTGPYRVAVLGIDPQQARDAIARTPGWLELSVVNSSSSVAVSGDTEAIAAVVRRVSESGRFAKEIEMWFPAHTTKLDTKRAELESMLPAGTFEPAPIPFIGSATAQVVPAGTDFADYWYTNLRSTVRFDDAVRAAVTAGAQTFVELSAHPALLYAMADVLDDVTDPPLMVGSGRRDEPLVDRLSANVAAVGLADAGFGWGGHTGELLRDFPFAPMRAQHHWAAPDPLPPVPGLKVLAERWEQRTPTPVATVPRRAAIVDLGEDGRLAAALSSRLDITDPVEADLLIVLAPVLDHLEAVAAADDLAARIDTGLLGYTEAIGPPCRDVWLVTVGGEQVRADEPGPLPAQAALAAMHRSVGLEHPEQSFGHLDLPSWELDDAAAALAAGALTGAAADVALRRTDSGPALFGHGTVEDRLPQQGWGAPGVLDEVVITGGSGAVGTHFVTYLAARGARRIVLLGRRGADTRRVAGVEVLAPPCDITDPVALAATAAEFGGGGASLVIHAAGAATMVGHRDLTGPVFADVVSAKVAGLAAFTATWPLRADTRIVLCSSVSGLWGGSGHTAYSAANRLLDVMAGQLRADGRHCTSVRWGLWPGSGIIDADEVARVERSGLHAMTPERAVEACLRDFAGDPLVFAADAERLQMFLGAQAEPAAPETSPGPSSDGLDAAGVLRVALGSVLNLPADTALEPSASLLDLGVDSLLALDLRKKLKKAAGVTVPLATILGGATVAEVLEHLERPEKKARLK